MGCGHFKSTLEEDAVTLARSSLGLNLRVWGEKGSQSRNNQSLLVKEREEFAAPWLEYQDPQ